MEKKDIIILCMTYFSILLFTSIYLLKIIKTKKYTPAHNGFIVALLIYYLIIPILVLCNIDTLHILELSAGKYGSDTFQRFIINGSWKNFIYSILMIVFTICFFICFYKIGYRKNKDIGYKHDSNKTYTIVKRLMYITFFVGMISLILFLISLGGIKQALTYAEKMRNMSNSLVEVVGNAALLKIIARLITITPFLAIYLINEKKEKTLLFKIILVTSLIFSVLFYLYNAGRAPIIMFFVCFLYYIMSRKIKKTWSIIILIGIVSLPLLDVLDSIFVYLNTGILEIKQTNYTNYIYQFSVPYKNTLILSDLNEMYGIRWGKDFITAFLDLLPGVNFDYPYSDLSLFVKGTEWKNLGGIPTDFITFAHMQFSFIGVIVFSSIMGYLSQKIDYKLSLFNDEKKKYLFGGALTIYFFSIISSFDIASLIRGQIILIFVIYIIIKSSKRE